jgi:hypothetical protein
MKLSLEYILLVGFLAIFMYRVYAWKQVFKESLSDQSKILKEKNGEIAELCSELLQQALKKFNEHEFHGRGSLLLITNGRTHNDKFPMEELQDTLSSIETLYFKSLTASPEVRSSTRITYQIICELKSLHEKESLYVRKDYFYHFVYLSLNLIFESLKSAVSVSKPNLIFPKSRYGEELAKYTVGENKDFFSETAQLTENNPMSHIFAAFYFEVLKKIPEVAYFKIFFKNMGYDNSILLADMALSKIAFSRMLPDTSKVIISDEKFDIGAIAQRLRRNTGLEENDKIEIFYSAFVFKRGDDNNKVVRKLEEFYAGYDAEISIVSEELGIVSAKLPKRICIDLFKESSAAIDYAIWEITGRSPTTFYFRSVMSSAKAPIVSYIDSVNKKIKRKFKKYDF